MLRAPLRRVLTTYPVLRALSDTKNASSYRLYLPSAHHEQMGERALALLAAQ